MAIALQAHVISNNLERFRSLQQNLQKILRKLCERKPLTMVRFPEGLRSGTAERAYTDVRPGPPHGTNIGNNNQGQEERSFGSESRRWRYPRDDRRLTAHSRQLCRTPLSQLKTSTPFAENAK
ncbi:hypothetical protein EOA33_32810 [Mesorhizobium sp. M4A.F.Ca.ET.050.02.1.1]|uniref:hypothetical protein n=1 Tax=Mesorhizobium sp. M4A.F.Ca.ET.050.02.1.1 TaxID=2496754 RepID=UPI000FCC5EE2|nr:hypothetical protein [Mesorhizobium sp. M4A.F.Ca.ET.050.02.1.1]RUX42104.1 hypothetical protein EOA33_32810 [Mesorhizobium sp. M4A.F.Ca.ET.050.02.1.1]